MERGAKRDVETMNISLPDRMKQFVEEQVSTGGYSSASEYVRELVRADQKRKAKEELEDILIKALSSGEPKEVTPQMWDELRRNIRARTGGSEDCQTLMPRLTVRPGAWSEIGRQVAEIVHVMHRARDIESLLGR